MIIDFHTHIFPDKIADRVIATLEQNANIRAHIRATADALVESMGKAGIDRSVVLQVVTAPKQTETVNKASAMINETMWDRGLIAFGGIHPEDENYKETLNFIAKEGMKGIKVHPVYQGVDFDDIRFKRILYLAEELGLITVTHAGLDIGVPGEQASPDKLRRTIDEVKPEKLVLAHLGGWNQTEEVFKYLVGRNVYFDTAFAIGRPYLYLEGKEDYPHPELCDKETLEKMMTLHGEDKFLFATDSPWSGQTAEVEKIKEMELSKEREQKLFSENARRILGI